MSIRRLLGLTILVICVGAGLTTQASAAAPAAVLKLALAGEIGQLDKLYRGHRSAGAEMAELHVYRVFESTNSRLTPSLDQWVSRAPDSAAAHTARGLHLLELARQTREGTPAQSAQHLQQSIADFSRATEVDPQFPLPRGLLITALAEYGDRDRMNAVARDALRRQPHSYPVRSAWLDAQRPALGGSFDAMVAESEAIEALVGTNPDLGMLRGYVYSTLADGYRQNRAWDKAVQFAEEAEAMGLDDRRLIAMARIYFESGDFAGAARRVERALGMVPDQSMGLYWKGRLAEQTEDRAAAATFYRQSLQADPANSAAIRYSARNLVKLGEFEGAEQMYQRGWETPLASDPGFIEDHLFLLVSKKKNFEKAEEIAAASQALFKGSRGLFWYSYGVALAGNKDCRTVAAMKRYQDNCRGTERVCNARALESAEKQIRSVVDSGRCEDMVAMAEGQ